MKSRSIVVPAELEGERADLIVARVLGVSRSVAKRMLEVVGQDAGARPGVGDAVQVGSIEAEDGLEPEPVPFAVMYEDDHVAVVDKPAGVVVHPGAGNRKGTLAAGLLHRWPQIEGVGAEGRWGVVHRLDRDTSGALIVAKTAEAHSAMSEMMRKRLVKRIYTGLAEGRFDFGTGTVDAPLGRDRRMPTRRKVDPMGKRAVTHYRVIKAGNEVTLLELELETGRTHQIRVHLAAIDHPLVGDTDYGSRLPGPGRIWLHAARVEFVHPIAEVPIEAAAPLPPELDADLANWLDDV